MSTGKLIADNSLCTECDAVFEERVDALLLMDAFLSASTPESTLKPKRIIIVAVVLAAVRRHSIILLYSRRIEICDSVSVVKPNKVAVAFNNAEL